MALEAGTYISDLVAANPLAADGSGQGDDHLRLLKSCIKATFPNITGAVTPTQGILNGLDGRVTAVEGLYVKKDGTVTMTGALNCGGFKHTNLAAAAVNGDAVRYEQLILKLDNVLTTRGDLIRGGVAGAAQRVGLGTSGQYLKSDGTDAAWANGPAAADLVTSGLVELATVAETQTGTDATRAVTPAGLKGALGFSKYYESGAQTVSNGGLTTLAHGLVTEPLFVQVLAICTADDSGYTAGQHLMLNVGENTGGNNTSRGFNVVVDATNLSIRIGSTGVGGQNFGTGAAVSFDLSKWQYKFRAWA